MSGRRIIRLSVPFIFLCALQLSSVACHSLGANSAADRVKRATVNGWTTDTNKLGLTFEEKVELVLAHNDIRRTPEASNMNFLYWQKDAENITKKRVDSCSTKIETYGNYKENYAIVSGSYNLTHIVNGWFWKSYVYDYHNANCQNMTCDDYRQLVFAESRRFACSMRFCNQVLGTVQAVESYLLICSYDPGADDDTDPIPYLRGTACSQCAPEYPKCDRDLCRSDPICDGLKCANGGKLLSDLCLCDCTGTGFDDATCGVDVVCNVQCENSGKLITDSCTCNCTGTGYEGDTCGTVVEEQKNMARRPSWRLTALLPFLLLALSLDFKSTSK